MKNYMFFIIYLLELFMAQSQTNGPSQQTVYTFTDDTYTNKGNVYINANYSRFRINNFAIGMQWGESPYMQKGLWLNASHGSSNVTYYGNSNLYNENTDMIHFIDNLSTNGAGTTPLLSSGFRYKPALIIDTTKIPYLQKRNNDPQRAVFGFKTVRGRIENYSSDPTNPIFGS